jgi:hypothetical protein
MHVQWGSFVRKCALIRREGEGREGKGKRATENTDQKDRNVIKEDTLPIISCVIVKQNNTTCNKLINKRDFSYYAGIP